MNYQANLLFPSALFSISPYDQVPFLGRTKKPMSVLFLKRVICLLSPIIDLHPCLTQKVNFLKDSFSNICHLQDNNLLSSLQSGFIPGDSAVNLLTFLYNTFCQALDSGKEVRAVFCNISKAFDLVWLSGLLYKLQVAGVTGDVLNWFKSYLSDRKQRVVLPSTVSKWTLIRPGVPQGSILGSLLFLVYINDIVRDIGSNIRLFADDSSLFIIVDNPLTAADSFNTDLNKISQWAAT